MSDTETVREALLGIEGAFAAARKRRLEVIREVGKLVPDEKALIESLLRREAADADPEAAPEARAMTALREVRAAAEARAALRGPQTEHVTALLDHAEGTWDWALDEAAARVEPLTGAVASPAADYVSALRELRRAFAELDEGAVQAAVAHTETALARLEQTLA
ncbi:MAG TPA: hypothetical protein VN238_04580 [Solirubrobacteraceae bacterium]|nr:hypothetical protein [Solirubrobacteraceae bacterium]